MKYQFWDVSRDRKKKPITLSDRLLELVAAAMAVCLLVLTGVLYNKAPDTVPSHFNFAMEADAWSGKGVYWVMAVVFIVMMAICASAAYNRKLVNLPVDGAELIGCPLFNGIHGFPIHSEQKTLGHFFLCHSKKGLMVQRT